MGMIDEAKIKGRPPCGKFFGDKKLNKSYIATLQQLNIRKFSL